MTLQVTNLGGGLYQNNLSSTVTSCIFAENSALQAFSGEGGGVYRNGVRGDLTNIYFENNDAALNGGGVFQVRHSPFSKHAPSCTVHFCRICQCKPAPVGTSACVRC